MELEERMLRLERSVRVWRCVAIGLILIAGSAGLASQGVTRVIEGDKFVLKDTESEKYFEIAYDGTGESRSLVFAAHGNDGKKRDLLFTMNESDVSWDMPGFYFHKLGNTSVFGAAGFSAGGDRFRFGSMDETLALIQRHDDSTSFSLRGDSGETGIFMTVAQPTEDHPGLGGIILRDASAEYKDIMLTPTKK